MGKTTLSIMLLCFVTLLIICTVSCNSNFSEISAKVSWSGDSTPKMMIPGSSRSLATLTALEANYTTLGTLRNSYTPSVFKLPIQALEVATSDSYLLPVPFHSFEETSSTWICQYADFTTPLAATPEGQILPGKYLTFFLFFFTNPGSMLMGSNNLYLHYSPSIEVDLGSEYDSIFADQLAWTGDSSVGDPSEPWTRKHLGNGQYRYTLSPLLPKTIEMVLFGGPDYDAVVPGLVESYEGNLLGYKETPGMESTYINGLVRIPWEGFTISIDAATVEFVVSWDLANIIEVYDAGTPDNLSDDKVVLAKGWWDRISLRVLQKDAAGNLL